MRRRHPREPRDEPLLGGAAGLLLILSGALHGGALGDKLGLAGAVIMVACAGVSLARLVRGRR